MDAQKVLNADLLDIIFEGRNKQYGAYHLRKVYEKHILRALLVGLSLIVVGFTGPVIANKISNAVKDADNKKVISDIELYDLKIEAPLPPPLPPPPNEPPPPPKNTMTYRPPMVEEDKNVVVESMPPKNDEIADDIANQTAVASNKVEIPAEWVGENPTTVPVTAPVEEMVTVFTNEAIEQPAEFPGGQVALMQWLSANVKYPAIARENGIQGRVVLKFIIERDGSVSNVVFLKKIHDLLDEESMRVVKSMPHWKRESRTSAAFVVTLRCLSILSWKDKV
jgi:periplasmic protein TonB